jgi:hypothetical protein
MKCFASSFRRHLCWVLNQLCSEHILYLIQKFFKALLCFVFFFFFGERVLPYIPQWPQTHYVLPQPPNYWDYRYAPTCITNIGLFFFFWQYWSFECRASNLLGRHPTTWTLFQTFFLLVRLGVWTQGFALAKQALYHLSHTSSPFYCGYFGVGGLMNYSLGLASNLIPPDLSRLSS